MLRTGVLTCLILSQTVSVALAELRAGATVVDVTPTLFPVLVNGGMLSRTADSVHTPVNARAIVVADDDTELAIVVVDSCMMPRDFLDEVKKLASDQTGIPADRMLISATHTHTAPASESCLGTNADPNYVPFLRARLIEAIAQAQANLEPAEVGYGVIDASEYTALRRWIRRPDRLADDPFGNPTVRANMHSGRNWDDVVGESGPKDPDLSLVSFRSIDGRPIAVLANFSMHYFGDKAIGADYFGLFCDRFQEQVGGKGGEDTAPFVAALSHGCSGDIWRRDYKIPDSEWKNPTIDEYTYGLLSLAMQAYEQIEYKKDVPVEMAETRLPMQYRTPDKQRLEWAQRIVEAMGDRDPQNTEEVYAREQVLLHEAQSTEVVVQGLRIGDIGIATTPTETYAITGLKIKAQSPLPHNIVFDLANGGDGYIPPPEQHLFGGYNTWAARSAGLEVTAEPRITEAAIHLLEQVTGAARKNPELPIGSATQQILDLKPLAYWRLDEYTGPRATDATGHQHSGIYEPHVTYALDGPLSDAFSKGQRNRAPHFVGERLATFLPELGTEYSISLWLWNGMPSDAREVTGWFASRGMDHVVSPGSDHFGIGGTSDKPGHLIYQSGNSDKRSVGTTPIERWTWTHVAIVRGQESVQVYVNGQLDLEAESSTPDGVDIANLFFGGRCDNHFNWEGRLDEVAVFNQTLSPDEVESLFARPE
ncbi:MAG: hypothetical protein KDA80_03360 [Planctomycetaceae bacterium]|nr:hypothetical protein [Planctomycetaceae bacterium]